MRKKKLTEAQALALSKAKELALAVACHIDGLADETSRHYTTFVAAHDGGDHFEAHYRLQRLLAIHLEHNRVDKPAIPMEVVERYGHQYTTSQPRGDHSTHQTKRKSHRGLAKAKRKRTRT